MQNTKNLFLTTLPYAGTDFLHQTTFTMHRPIAKYNLTISNFWKHNELFTASKSGSKSKKDKRTIQKDQRLSGKYKKFAFSFAFSRCEVASNKHQPPNIMQKFVRTGPFDCFLSSLCNWFS